MWLVLFVSFPLLVFVAIAGTLLTLPSVYGPFDAGHVSEDDFTADDKEDADRSGYAFFSKHKDSNGRLRTDVTVQVVVLGDIGRSPRMQYHALSIASHGGKVNLIGYVDSEVHPDLLANRYINIIPITPFPKFLQTSNKLLFLLLAPFKIAWQTWNLYYTLGYRSEATKWMLVQNPPSIPTLIVAQFICFYRHTLLVIDWHNLGYSILAMRLGADHKLVKYAKRYEAYWGSGATANFTVTNAMAKVLEQKWGIKATALHDRPPKYFQPLSAKQRSEFLRRLPETAEYASDIDGKAWRLLVSSTSWTQDEDFSLLLDALVAYSTAIDGDKTLPKILAIITGKGPQKDHYLSQIRRLNQEGKLSNVLINTAWLSAKDYAALLGSADLGVSLHTSSSGVDLPMKVVDMFGAGLPVVGWSKFEAWPELVQEGKNGRGFESADGLADLLRELFGAGGQKLNELRSGALKESERRWEDEWMPVAGKLFALRP